MLIVAQIPRFLPWLLIAGVAAMAGCSWYSNPPGPLRRESRSIELDGSERVRVNLKLAAGELHVRGGAQKFVDAAFTYNVEAWKPDIRYTSGAGVGDLEIEQHGHGRYSGNTTNRWELAFNQTVPLQMRAELGAGTAEMNLGSLMLRSLEINMGAGTLDLDLRGSPTKDYAVRIRGGVGEATVRLPKDIGVRARASGGIGGISVKGLHQNVSGDYENEAYEHAAVRIHLDIQGGVGSVNLISE